MIKSSWIHRRCEYVTKDGTTSLGGALRTQVDDFTFLCDWDDGSTSLVLARPPLGETAPLRAAVTVKDACQAPKAPSTPSSRTNQSIPPKPIKSLIGAKEKSVEAPISVLVELLEGEACWYKLEDPTHAAARSDVAKMIFDELVKHKLAARSVSGGSAPLLKRTVAPTSRPGRPPSEAESASKWKAAEETKAAKAASSCLTSVSHTAAYLESLLLRESTGLAAFRRPATLASRIQAAQKASGQGRNRGESGTGVSVSAALLHFLRHHGPLEGSLFRDGEVQWMVYRVGVDAETQQRVVYYFNSEIWPHAPPSLGSCEWSSLKEVWAWIIRDAASCSDADDEALYTKVGGLRGLADAVEHTDVGDGLLSGDGLSSSVDIPASFLDDFWAAAHASSISTSSSAGKARQKLAVVTSEVMLAALESIALPENSSRINVRQTPDQVFIF